MELILGIVCGIALSLFFSFGAAFFTLIQNSVQYGYRKAMAFALGISASDASIVFLMVTVFRSVDMYAVVHNVWVAAIGAAVMIFMGIRTLRSKNNEADIHEHASMRTKFINLNTPRRRNIMIHGFLLNFFNPLIWVYWIAIIAMVRGEFDMSTTSTYIFFAGVLGATLSLDLLKCKLASLLQNIITAKVLNILNKSVAILLFGFAAFLLISMANYQFNPKAREKQIEQEKKSQSVTLIKEVNDKMKKIDSITILPADRHKTDSMPANE